MLNVLKWYEVEDGVFNLPVKRSLPEKKELTDSLADEVTSNVMENFMCGIIQMAYPIKEGALKGDGFSMFEVE